MAELPPEMARLIEAARRAHDPSEADCERVRRGLAAAIGGQASLGPSSGTEGAVGSASSGAWSGLFGSAGGKLLVAAALVGGAGGVWTWRASREPPRGAAPPALVTAAQRPQPAPQPAPALQARPAQPLARTREPAAVGGAAAPRPAPVRAGRARAADSATPPVRPARAADSAPPPVRPARAADSAARPARAAVVAAAPASARAPAPGAQQTEEPARASEAASAARAVEEVATQRVPTAHEVPREIAKEESEVASIRAALASLNAGDAQRALALLDAHAARYPASAMGRERAGLRVLALCAVGRLQEGRAEQAAFLEAATDSPLQNRVRRACE